MILKRKIVKTAALALCLMCIGGQVYAAPVEQETETVTSEVLAQESVAESEPGTVPGETAQETAWISPSILSRKNPWEDRLFHKTT